ncbi:hypothetical protein ES708_26592 [subsurface metagenome]
MYKRVRWIYIIIGVLLFACEQEKPEPPDYSSKKDVIPQLSTTTVTNITHNSATSGGNVTDNGGASITARGICWNTTGNPIQSDNKTIDGTGTGSFTSNLTDLQGETNYFLRAYATNTIGTAYGNEIDFTTLYTPNGSFTDSRDGNTYNWTRIGSQVWMAENLAYLPSVSPASSGARNNPYYYVYAYEGANISEAKATDNYKTYGVLYNWRAAMEGCPSGWHLPSDNEWSKLINYIGGESIAGGKMKETDTVHWKSPNTGATNNSGFTGLPGGVRHYNGYFENISNAGSWWSTLEVSNDYVWSRHLFYDSNSIRRGYGDKERAFSVRCVKD